jgi:hypothetical protein
MDDRKNLSKQLGNGKGFEMLSKGVVTSQNLASKKVTILLINLYKTVDTEISFVLLSLN